MALQRTGSLDYDGDIALDDIIIQAAPSCITPTVLNATSITSSSATLGWTTGGASNWRVEYGTTGFVLGTGSKVSATTNPIVVTGLMPNTTYQFYVKDSCSTTSVSLFAGPFSFTTPCAVINIFPHTENFEGATTGAPGVLPACWSSSATTTYRWEVDANGTTSSNTGPSVDHTLGTSAGYYAGMDDSHGSYYRYFK